MLLLRAFQAAALLCLLSVTALVAPEILLRYGPKWAPASEPVMETLEGHELGLPEQVLDNGVNLHRAFRPLDISRAPDGPAWSNSLALCTMIKWERPEDVLEWVQYYKCALGPTWLYSHHPCCERACTLCPFADYIVHTTKQLRI